jgi:hypothetical protein
MTIKNIKLQRKLIGNYNNLFGKLTISTINNGKFYFNTIENNEKKIISGTYDIGYTHSPRFGKETLIIKGVPKRYGLRIHAANRGSELEGCIAVGLHGKNKEIPQQIYYSRQALGQLEALLQHTNLMGYQITIKDIKDENTMVKNSRSSITQIT